MLATREGVRIADRKELRMSLRHTKETSKPAAACPLRTLAGRHEEKGAGWNTSDIWHAIASALYIGKQRKENHAASRTLSVVFLLPRWTESICVQLSFKYVFPILFQTKINAKSQIIFHGKKTQECKVSCSHSLWCQQLPQILAWASRSRGESRARKGRSCWLQGILGQGEQASIANETLRLCFKESRWSLACAWQYCGVSVTLQVKWLQELLQVT